MLQQNLHLTIEQQNKSSSRSH